MLVLTRKVGQNITVGDSVRISVIDIRGRQVRLGVEAPNDMPIHREEVYLRIQEQNIEAAAARPDDLDRALELVGGAQGRESE